MSTINQAGPTTHPQGRSTNGGKYAIEASSLNVFYGAFRAVKDFDLNVERQKITALIGSSGCGKSTVLRSFNRMNELIPSAHIQGAVLFHGKNIYDADVDPVEVRRHVGMVFQKPNPFPKSIYDNVLWGAKINGFKGQADERVLINTQMLENESYFERLMIQLVIGSFDKMKVRLEPESARYINKLLVKEYLAEYQGKQAW